MKTPVRFTIDCKEILKKEHPVGFTYYTVSFGEDRRLSGEVYSDNRETIGQFSRILEGLNDVLDYLHSRADEDDLDAIRLINKHEL